MTKIHLTKINVIFTFLLRSRVIEITTLNAYYHIKDWLAERDTCNIYVLTTPELPPLPA